MTSTFGKPSRNRGRRALLVCLQLQQRANPKHTHQRRHGRPAVLAAREATRYPHGMSTLAEIQAAAAVLPPEQKQELLLFLASRLRAEGGSLPEPRAFSREQMAAWIHEDEADMRRFSEDQ